MNIPTPKAVFCKSNHSKKWVDLTASDMWQEAAHAALAQMTLSTQGGDPGFATKIQGAKEILVILSNLADPAPKNPKTVKNLNHNV